MFGITKEHFYVQTLVCDTRPYPCHRWRGTFMCDVCQKSLRVDNTVRFVLRARHVYVRARDCFVLANVFSLKLYCGNTCLRYYIFLSSHLTSARCISWHLIFLKPCFIASHLTSSQLIPSHPLTFHLILFHFIFHLICESLSLSLSFSFVFLSFHFLSGHPAVRFFDSNEFRRTYSSPKFLFL